MTREEAVEAYSKKFGGFPCFLFPSVCPDDEYVISAVEEALKTGKEIEPEKDDVDY